MKIRTRYEVVVIGGGHAGVEAAWAASSALGEEGCVALVTTDPSRIGALSCNPAIGGLGKGQIVREIDALGGLMGLAADESGIMFKLLNTSKGPAVQGPRAQVDVHAYPGAIQARLASRADRIHVIAATIDDLVADARGIRAIRVPAGAALVSPDRAAIEANVDPEQRPRPVYAGDPVDRLEEAAEILAGAVVLTGGTFMRGLMHTGECRTSGGRVGESAADGISGTLRRLGFELGRLKTGTPPRLVRASLDWDAMEVQEADAYPRPFSDLSPNAMPSGRFPHRTPLSCRITATNEAMHDLVRANLHRSAMYSGAADAECGPRYCPSLEDKIVRFGDRSSHHVFLEPESAFDDSIYANGISTSLPVEVQTELVRGLPGCERAEIRRPGYAVEYDMVWPHQIDATCMTRRVPGLLLAGQINCTTGYEEAAGQGLVAGVNAARFVRGLEPVRLGRDQAYVGVMMDDLVTKPPREPYRMFTSRAEHRLRLRADTSAERLTRLGAGWGLVEDARLERLDARDAVRARVHHWFDGLKVGGKPLATWVRRPEVTVDDVASRLPEPVDRDVLASCIADTRYATFVARQDADVRRSRDLDRRTVPAWFEPAQVTGLRSEAAEALARHRPSTLGIASRLPGITPADVTLIEVAIRRGRRDQAASRAADSSGDRSASR